MTEDADHLVAELAYIRWVTASRKLQHWMASLVPNVEQPTKRILLDMLAEMELLADDIANEAKETGFDIPEPLDIPAAVEQFDDQEKFGEWLVETFGQQDRKMGLVGFDEGVLEALDYWPGDIPWVVEDYVYRCSGCHKAQLGGPDGYIEGVAYYSECPACAADDEP